MNFFVDDIELYMETEDWGIDREIRREEAHSLRHFETARV